MNYEIILAFMRYICTKTKTARYREGMYQLHELLFLYNYAWIEISESAIASPQHGRSQYITALNEVERNKIDRHAA